MRVGSAAGAREVEEDEAAAEGRLRGLCVRRGVSNVNAKGRCIDDEI